MKINLPFLNQLGGLLGSAAIRWWMSTLDCRAAYYDPTSDPVQPGYNGAKIYVFWHEYLLFPIHMRGHCNLAMLVSRHRDAEILSHAAYHLGFDLVRGSTTRGGAAALRELVRKSRQMNLTITPDGPRGPRRVLSAGPVYLASKLQLPLVPFGMGYDRPWRLKSWDRFAIPRPGSRGRAIVGPQMNIPADLSREGIEHYRREVEHLLNTLTSESERWADQDTVKREEVVLKKQPLWKPIQEQDDAEVEVAENLLRRAA